MISEDLAEKSLHYLIETSEEYAQATANSRYYYNLLKETYPDFLRECEADGYVQSEGSQDLRKSLARSSNDYKELVQKRKDVLESYKEAEYKRVRLEAGRDAARSTLSLYQSQLRNSGGM